MLFVNYAILFFSGLRLEDMPTSVRPLSKRALALMSGIILGKYPVVFFLYVTNTANVH